MVAGRVFAVERAVLNGGVQGIPSITIKYVHLSRGSGSRVGRFVRTTLRRNTCFFSRTSVCNNNVDRDMFNRTFTSSPSLGHRSVCLRSGYNVHRNFCSFSGRRVLGSISNVLGELRASCLSLLLLRHPSTLMRPRRITSTFSILFRDKGIHRFNISGRGPVRVRLLRGCIHRPLIIGRIRFDVPISGLITGNVRIGVRAANSVSRSKDLLSCYHLRGVALRT